MADRRLPTLIATLSVVLVTAVLWNAFAPPPRSSERRAPQLLPDPVGRTPALRAPPPPPPPPDFRRPALVEAPPNQLSFIDQLARAEARRRIRSSAGYTYLGEILAASGDSSLRRWDDRYGRPIRVYLSAGTVEHFQAGFLSAVRSAFERWVDAGVPVQFNLDADSTTAEVVVRWTLQFGIERTGQTDLTSDHEGRILSGVVTIATLDPKGNPLTYDDVRVVALHEVGHVLGLDHSADSTDIMFASTQARDLSSRDIRTMELLYQLAPGPVR